MNTSATNLNPVVQHSNQRVAQAINSSSNNNNINNITTTTTTTTTPNNNQFTTNNNNNEAATINTTTSTTTATNTTNGSLSDSLASTDGYRTPNVDNHHQLSKTNLYIRGLQQSTSDQDLYNMCSRFGDITSTKAILDKTTGCCRGYGFVEFIKPQSAEVAVQELTKSGIQAQMAKITSLYSSHHQQHHHHHHHNHHHNNNSHNNSSGNTSSNNNNQQQQQHHNQNASSSNNNNADPTNLYIANLPPNMSEEELENLLSTYGHVVSTRILRDQSNIPRGVGFARMESKDKCEQIIEQLNGRPCKGWKEPLLVKYADGGAKKRHHHNNQHHNNNHHQHHKTHQEDNRWRDSSNTSDHGTGSSFDLQSNISHSNHLSDLAMMSSLSYPRIQHGFPPTVAAGAAYPASMGPPTSAPQWIHPGGPGQPYVIPQQMIQAGGLAQSNQAAAAAAAAAALHYGHIPQLTSQMQSLQIAHSGAPVGGYLPPQHQWSALWPHPMAQQPQPSMRLPTMQPLPPSPQATPVQQSQQQQPPIPQQQTSTSDTKLQVSLPM